MDAALNLFQSVGGALLALGLLAVAGWIAITRIRAWMRQTDDTDEGFTLADLRRLHREGQLTDEEFARAQGQIISAVRTKPSRKDAVSTKAPPSPANRASEQPKPDDQIDLLAERDGAAPPIAAPRALRDASGRIVIRDDASASGDPPRRPSADRPTKPSDPRTDQPQS